MNNPYQYLVRAFEECQSALNEVHHAVKACTLTPEQAQTLRNLADKAITELAAIKRDTVKTN